MDYRRNPYGARGGYVGDRAYYDMARRGRRDYDYDMDYEMDYAKYGPRHHYAEHDYESDYAYEHPRYDGHRKSSHDELDDHTVEMWAREMMQEIEPVHHQKFKMEAIIKKAEDMGIRFDKFTPHEFYATVIMLVSDFGKTLGMTNVDIYTRLAKDWLCDPDAGVKYGDKLAAYYHHIANV